MWDVILDSLFDTLKLLPFLFVLYILIELMEHRTRMGKPSALLKGKAAPFIGAATGLVPMCGFSVMGAKLYERRYLTIGALVAVFIATNDEALLVLLLSNLDWAQKAISVLALCGIKLAVGTGVGYLTDFLFRSRRTPPQPLAEETEEHAEHEEEEHGHSHDELTACSHKHESIPNLYIFSPLVHALEVAAVVLIVNLAFGLLFFGIGGGDRETGAQIVGEFLQVTGYWYQPVLCALVGLIPNCAASVTLAQTFAMGGIAFGSCLAGLIPNTGLGLLILFKYREERKTAVAILLGLFVLGVALGYAVNAVAIAIG